MQTFEQYTNKVNRVGRLIYAFSLITFLGAPFIIAKKYGIEISIKQYLNSSIGLFLLLTPVAISELLSYTPILGPGATYVSFITGNVSNIKFPCVMNSMKMAKVTPGTEESDVLSTIAVCASAFSTVLTISIGALLLIPLESVFSHPAVVTATNYIMPALFGGMLVSIIAGTGQVKGGWKAGILPFIITAILSFIIPISQVQGFIILIMLPVTIFSAKKLYEKGHIQIVEAPEEEGEI